MAAAYASPDHFSKLDGIVYIAGTKDVRDIGSDAVLLTGILYAPHYGKAIAAGHNASAVVGHSLGGSVAMDSFDDVPVLALNPGIPPGWFGRKRRPNITVHRTYGDPVSALSYPFASNYLYSGLDQHGVGAFAHDKSVADFISAHSTARRRSRKRLN